MLPSVRLIIAAAVASSLFLAGAIFPPLAAGGLVYVLLLCLWALVDALLLPRARRVTVSRTVPERISLAAPTRVVLEVHNGSRRRVEIRLSADLPEPFRAEPDECAGVFDPGARRLLESRVIAQRRGRYRLSRIDVRVLPAGGLFYRQFRLDLPQEVHVYPNLVNLKRHELLVRRGLTREEGLARLRQIGQGMEFESLRQYVPGDDLSRVEWKTTAKRRQLIVKNYQPERRQSVLCAIDVGRATAGEFHGISRLDYLINAALMLAYVVLRQGDWFSLAAFSDRIESYLPPTRGIKNIDRVARALYQLEPRLVESDYSSACRFLGLKNRKRSLICLMTDVIDQQASGEILAYMARFARRHLPLAVTLADPEIVQAAECPLRQMSDPFDKAIALDVQAARKAALTAMRRRGVEVLDVPPTSLTVDLINRYLLIKATRRL